MNKIKTPEGFLYYKFKPLYPGIKQINKEKANENLQLLKRILKEQNLNFGLAYGTILGAVRDHDFITHDEDIDLYILKEDETLFLSTLVLLNNYGFNIVRNDRRGLISIMRNGEYIDFYIFSKYKKGIRICSGMLIPEKFLTETIDYPLLGSYYKIPKDYEIFFEYEYGSNWSTPIPYVDFNMTRWKKFSYIIKEHIKNLLPNFIYIPIKKHLENKSIRKYSEKITKLDL